MKRELSWKEKAFNLPVCLNSTLIYGFKLWVETESVRLWIKAGIMCFLRSVVGLSLRERMRRGGDHGVELELTGTPRRTWKALRGKSTSGTPCLPCCRRCPIQDNQKAVNGWIKFDLQETKACFTFYFGHSELLFCIQLLIVNEVESVWASFIYNIQSKLTSSLSQCQRAHFLLSAHKQKWEKKLNILCFMQPLFYFSLVWGIWYLTVLIKAMVSNHQFVVKSSLIFNS